MRLFSRDVNFADGCFHDVIFMDHFTTCASHLFLQIIKDLNFVDGKLPVKTNNFLCIR